MKVEKLAKNGDKGQNIYPLSPRTRLTSLEVWGAHGRLSLSDAMKYWVDQTNPKRNFAGLLWDFCGIFNK